MALSSSSAYWLRCALITFLLASPLATALAQTTYPTKPIQLVVPYPPGGSDVLPRRLVIGMAERLGQPIVVVNKPGASTQVATSYIVSAPKDGYTLYFANPGELAAGPSLFKSLPFDALADLTPITFVADAPLILVSTSELPAKTFADLTALMRSNPQALKFASYGVQSQQDVAARRFNLALGTSIPVIPYQGGAPALNAIVRNEVQLLFPTMIPSRPFIVSGQMRAYAVAFDKRVPLYPDLPTLRELGIDLVETGMFGIMGPKGIPQEVVTKIHDALVAELKKPEIKQFLDGLGIIPVGSTPEAFAARLREMTAHWAALSPKIGLEKQ